MTDDVPQVPHDTWRDIEGEHAEGMQGSLIMCPQGEEGVAVVSVAMSPGQSIPLGPPFRFEGWLHDRKEAVPCSCGGRHMGVLLDAGTFTPLPQGGVDDGADG